MSGGIPQRRSGHLRRRRRHEVGWGRPAVETGVLAAQSLERHAGRRIEARHWRQGARVCDLVERSRGSFAGGICRRMAAYWIDPKSGAWITSTFYRPTFPSGCATSILAIARRNSGTANGKMRPAKFSARPRHATGRTERPAGFYEVVGSTPFRATSMSLILQKNWCSTKNWGRGPATDLLAISLSANDILGHQVGPDSPQMRGMALALDRQIADFFDFLGHQVGMANVWMALSADHGIAPLPEFARVSATAGGGSRWQGNARADQCPARAKVRGRRQNTLIWIIRWRG